MDKIDLFSAANSLHYEQPDFGEDHIRSVRDLVVGSTVTVMGTNGEN